MRKVILALLIATMLVACDESRVFEKNFDFDDRAWRVNEKPVFEFDISDAAAEYNLYCNLRNTVSYPYSRMFVTYELQDSAGKALAGKMVSHLLFDPATGKPAGTSGLGDIYDHRIPLLTNHRFAYAGKHKLVLEQFMRADTLQGILAVGVRVEKSVK